MATKVFHIEEFGEVKFTKHHKAKFIKLKISASSGLQVTLPENASYDTALKFLETKKTWIKENLNKFEKREPLFRIDDFPLACKFYTIHLKSTENHTFEVSQKKRDVFVGIPDGKTIEDTTTQNYIKRILSAVYKKEAQKYLPVRLYDLAKEHNFSYKKVGIRNQKSRWGSCSHDNSISLNYNLMRLPDDLIDYVLLHELAHTIEKNHQEGFWKLLDKVTNKKAKYLDKKLKDWNIPKV